MRLLPARRCTPAGPTTAGLLRRRPTRSAPVLTALIGKEGNRLLERATGEISEPADYRTSYSQPDVDRWRQLVLPALREIRDTVGTKRLAQELGVSDRQVRNWLAERDVPHAGATLNRQRVERYALDWASSQLQAAGRSVPADAAAVLHAYLQL